MENIKLKNNLKSLTRLGEITKAIIDKVQLIHNYADLKNDLEILLYICNIIENEIKQTKTKSINKKQIVIDILQRVFNYKPDELLIIGKHIDFLHTNNLIIKITEVEKASSLAYNWFLKKVG